MSDTQDAIERAQAWLEDASSRPWNPDEMIYTLEEEPQAEVNARLAALGPASVALAAALRDVRDAMGREGTGHVANPETAFAYCLGCKAIATADKALAQWAQAVVRHD